jgi:hypothetical protein
MWGGQVGVLLYVSGRFEAARGALVEACAVTHDAGDARFESLFQSYLAGAYAALERKEQALAAIDAADQIGARCDQLHGAMLALRRADVELVLARSALWRGDREAAELLASRAQRTIEAARSQGASNAVEIVTAQRIAERSLAATTNASAVAPHANRASNQPASRMDGVLMIERSGQWFQPPGGNRVNCTRRHSHSRIVAMLAQQRVRAPGMPLERDELIDAGWPGERIAPIAAWARLKVALSELRRRGLEGVLLRRNEGYLLDDRVPIELWSASEERHARALRIKAHG